ncbi:MAG: DUF885 family protein [Alphaproteobacteria bacterium]|nr:DUF885 family protein [Alphaproteobacteria bacterium]
MRNVLAGIAAVALLSFGIVGCGDKSVSEQARVEASASLKTLLGETATAILKESPGLATSLGIGEDIAGGPYMSRLADASPEGLKRQAALAAALAARFDAIDRKALSGQDAASYDVVRNALRYSIAGNGFGYGNYGLEFTPTPYVVSQLTGSYQSVPDFLDSQHPLRNGADAEAYIARLEAFAVNLDHETARVKADAEKGVIPPTYVLERTLEQMRPLAGAPAPTTTMVRSIQRRIGQAEGVTPVQGADFTRRAITAVRDKVQPALRRQIDAIVALQPRAKPDAAVSRLPDGANYYKAALAAWTTSEMTPDEIHQMGLDLITDLTKQMDELLKAQGYAEGSVAERVQAISKDARQVYPNTDAGKARLISDLNQQVTMISARLPEQFVTLPKARLDIKRVPVEIEAGAPGGYYQPGTLDGSRAGAYYINLRNTAEWPRFSLPTLTYHEGIPGHHMQNAIAQEANCTETRTTDCIPLIRSSMLWFSGYGEGWALYSEQIADEMGMYKDNPVGRLGYLQSMAFRAARLVVDTGLHSKGWTREQAIDYMVGVTGDQPSSIATEVERYIVWPGQACAYMVGRQTINRLRDSARTELGAKFDIRAFHDRVLLDGPVPLSVLEANVTAWIKAQK